MEIFFKTIIESLKISFFVLLMMGIVDVINMKTKGKLENILKGGRKFKQYVVASFLGATPGCLGAFAGVSLYIHGMLSFGALTGLMLATAGDEQFIMLAMFPGTALTIFIILFFIGIAAGIATDLIIRRFKIRTCSDCIFEQYHPGEEGYGHYFKEHLWKHIFKGHIIKVFLWTFLALLLVEYSMSLVDIQSITGEYSFLFLLFAALIGIIPESGPHLIFVMLYAKGFIPFSILFTSAIVQDGHGMLPLLSFSVRDSIKIKMFNVFFGLLIGIIIYLAGY